MYTGTLLFLGGVLTLLSRPVLPEPWLLWLLPIALAAAYSHHHLRLLGLFVAGFLWALLHAHLILSVQLPSTLEGKDLLLRGEIASLPQRLERGVRFEFHVLEGVDSLTGGRIRINWYSPPKQGIRVGEEWRLTVRLKRPRGFSNPGGFDYEGWLFRQRLRATGYVRGQGENLRLRESNGYPVAELRQRLAEAIDEWLTDSPTAGMVKALTVGVRQGMEREQWHVLRATGTSHLMAISGLHVGLAAGFAFFLGRGLWSRSVRCINWMAAPRFAALSAFGAALGYAALAGFSIPTQRATVMVGLFMMALFFRMHIAPGRTLVLALFLVLLLDPLSATSPGFWLSFGAVAVILFGMGGRGRINSLWWRWGRVHIVVAIGLLPLLLGLFGENPLLSAPANLVAVPWMGMLVVPLALLGTLLLLPLPDLGGWLLSLASQAIELLWPYLELLAGLDWTHRAPPSADPWLLAGGLTGALLLLAPRGFPGRWLGLIWLLPLIFFPIDRPEKDVVRFTLLDVGQGLAAVVRTRNHLLLYDAGPRYSPRFDTGEAVVLPFLREKGLTRIDRLVLSNGDNDHAGGAASVLAGIQVGEVISSGTGPVPVVRPCKRGDEWEWDGVRFRFLHPSNFSPNSSNNRSCVLMVNAAGGTILLTGDIEAEAERELGRRFGDRLNADILTAPHHGSLTSSSPAFLDRVRPQHVLFSAGYRNRYRFPRPEVLERYRSRGALTFDTAGSGAISYELKPGAPLPQPQLHRTQEIRFWQH